MGLEKNVVSVGLLIKQHIDAEMICWIGAKNTERTWKLNRRNQPSSFSRTRLAGLRFSSNQGNIENFPLLHSQEGD